MLDALTSIVQSALIWCESCPCHGSLPTERIPPHVRQAWLQCPLRGCRAPELASGGFMNVLRSLADTGAGQLLSTLPRDVDAAQRATLLNEFERGRAHLLLVFAVRLEHWRQPPWNVFACAHMDASVSRSAVRRAIAAQPTSLLVQELQSQEIVPEARSYAEDGSNLHELPNLVRFLSKLLFCPIAERRVEGDHAQAGYQSLSFHVPTYLPP